MPDTGAEKGIPEIFTDGKWIGTAMGHDDELIAEVVVANGDLASIRVLRCDDTIGIGTTAAPMMASKRKISTLMSSRARRPLPSPSGTPSRMQS